MLPPRADAYATPLAPTRRRCYTRLRRQTPMPPADTILPPTLRCSAICADAPPRCLPVVCDAARNTPRFCRHVAQQRVFDARFRAIRRRYYAAQRAATCRATHELFTRRRHAAAADACQRDVTPRWRTTHASRCAPPLRVCCRRHAAMRHAPASAPRRARKTPTECEVLRDTQCRSCFKFGAVERRRQRLCRPCRLRHAALRVRAIASAMRRREPPRGASARLC